MAVLEVSSEQLLKAIMQLPEPELERFLAQVLALRPRHAECRLSQAESELLLKINQGIPAGLQHRYNELIGKRRFFVCRTCFGKSPPR